MIKTAVLTTLHQTIISFVVTVQSEPSVELIGMVDRIVMEHKHQAKEDAHSFTYTVSGWWSTIPAPVRDICSGYWSLESIKSITLNKSVFLLVDIAHDKKKKCCILTNTTES